MGRLPGGGSGGRGQGGLCGVFCFVFTKDCEGCPFDSSSGT